MKNNILEMLDRQTFQDGKRHWRISRLIFMTSNLPVMEIPLEHLNIHRLFPEAKDTLDHVKHIQKVLDADLSCPIILDEEGYVMDGRHRLCKALLRKAKTIKAVRFSMTPDCDYMDKD